MKKPQRQRYLSSTVFRYAISRAIELERENPSSHPMRVHVVHESISVGHYNLGAGCRWNRCPSLDQSEDDR